jgi:putative phosphoribosyl transferase
MPRWRTRSDAGVRYRDRREAGRVLAGRLLSYRGRHGVLVLGLARGGVPVGWEVAAALAAPFDVFLVRKLGVPQWPELAMGALATGGAVVRNDDLIRSQGITEEQLRSTIERESDELRRRESVYRGDRVPAELSARTVILVDDGIATGASMLAAVRAVRVNGAARVVVAVPVGSATACRHVGHEADELACVSTPADFRAVGQAYQDFTQTTDEEVCALLGERPHRAGPQP